MCYPSCADVSGTAQSNSAQPAVHPPWQNKHILNPRKQCCQRQKNIKLQPTSWNRKDPREDPSVCSSLPKREHWGTPLLATSPNKRPSPHAATTCSPSLSQEPMRDTDAVRANLHWHQDFCWPTCQPVCGNNPSSPPNSPNWCPPALASQPYGTVLSWAGRKPRQLREKSSHRNQGWAGRGTAVYVSDSLCLWGEGLGTAKGGKLQG